MLLLLQVPWLLLYTILSMVPYQAAAFYIMLISFVSCGHAGSGFSLLCLAGSGFSLLCRRCGSQSHRPSTHSHAACTHACACRTSGPTTRPFKCPKWPWASSASLLAFTRYVKVGPAHAHCRLGVQLLRAGGLLHSQQAGPPAPLYCACGLTRRPPPPPGRPGACGSCRRSSTTSLSSR